VAENRLPKNAIYNYMEVRVGVFIIISLSIGFIFNVNKSKPVLNSLAETNNNNSCPMIDRNNINTYPLNSNQILYVFSHIKGQLLQVVYFAHNLCFQIGHIWL